jgi:hypothetical protein
MSSSLIPFQQRAKIAAGGARLQVADRTARLLYISEDPAPDGGLGVGISIRVGIYDGEVHIDQLSSNEPSTIYTALPVRRPSDPTAVPRPPYYPSYAGLSPEQRWVYLNWLTDVTQEVNIGYVFIYYYGLERHLLLGEFELAFDEILHLRTIHGVQSSFDAYSRAALLNAALVHKSQTRLEQLYRLAPPSYAEDTDLILAHRLGQDLGADGLIRIAHGLRDVKKRYLKSDPSTFRDSIAAVLTGEFGEPHLPFASRYRIADLPKCPQMLFANISFPDNIRTPSLPSFLHHPPFVNEASRVLNNAHELTKAEAAQARKAKKRGNSA